VLAVVIAVLAFRTITRSVWWNGAQMDQARSDAKMLTVGRNPSEEFRSRLKAGAPPDIEGVAREALRSDPSSCDELVYTLCRYGSRSIVPVLLDGLRKNHGEWELAQQRISVDGVEPSVEAHKQYRWAYRLAFTVFVETGDRIADDLSGYFEDADASVREVAARALAAMGTERSVRLFLQAARHADGRVRLAAAQSLREAMSSRALGADEAYRLTEALCRDPEPEVRLCAVRVLVMFRGLPARRTAERLEGDPDPKVREEAEKVLESLPSLLY
jgi:HEAT repeat protein